MAANHRRCALWPHRALAALVAVAVLATHSASAANILAILSTPTRSHHIWSSVFVEALSGRGHNLTVLSPTQHRPPLPNVTDLVLEGSLDFSADADYQAMAQFTPLEWLPGTFDWYYASCQYSLTTNGVRQLSNYPDDFRFDLIIIEASGGECLLAFVEKFGRPPVVAVNGFGNPQWINWIIGNPDNPAYVSNAQLALRWPFSFLDKLKNVGMYAATLYYYYWQYLPATDALVKKFLGNSPAAALAPPVAETLSNVSLLLVNAHYSLDGARPFVPNMIPIAGMHVKEPKPLPKDLQQWLDDAKEGVVYFSLGSIVRSDSMLLPQRSAFVEAFKELPRGMRVLWKWERDAPPEGLSPNVRVSKWLPQRDILAHPNVRVFISHAGMMSTHEAVWRGVPVVALPFVVDQYLNAHRLVTLGVGERLDYLTLTKKDVVTALNRVLGDSGYRERMRELSALFRERPQAPLDAVVYWIEHVLRHGGAPRMRSPTAELAWYQLWLLDVAAVAALALVAAIVAVLLPIAYLVRIARRKGDVKSKSNKGKNKSKAE